MEPFSEFEKSLSRLQPADAPLKLETIAWQAGFRAGHTRLRSRQLGTGGLALLFGLGLGLLFNHQPQAPSARMSDPVASVPSPPPSNPVAIPWPSESRLVQNFQHEPFSYLAQRDLVIAGDWDRLPESSGGGQAYSLRSGTL